MAVLPNYSATLADLAARMGPDDTIVDVVNMLSQTNPILEDLVWVEANDGTTHKSVIRTGLPGGAWRILNYGVPYGKSTTAPVTDGTAMLEMYSKVDRDLVRLAGANGAAFRASEAMAATEGISQQMASALFYGNSMVHPERFTGLSPRFSTVSPANALNAVNVIDAGGQGTTNTSIWLCSWGPTTGFGIYPRGSKAGLSHEDVTTDAPVADPNGNPYRVYQDHYKWDCGLVVRDWRYFVRICNIDVTQLTGANSVNLFALLIAAVNKLPQAALGIGPVQSMSNNSGAAMTIRKPVLYANRAIMAALDLQSLATKNLQLHYTEIDGRPQTMFRTIPVRTSDSLLNTEARVV